MSIDVRESTGSDAQTMADILNRIIEIGGTTAISGAQTSDDWIDLASGAITGARCHVATDPAEQVVGFQFITPHPDLPDNTLDIATFVRPGIQQSGIGTALFQRSRQAAQDVGAAWLVAVIRKVNSGGQAYYGRMGLVDHDQTDEKIFKRRAVS